MSFPWAGTSCKSARTPPLCLCKAIQVLLTQYCPMLLYLGHLVRQCNWAGETANTGVFASEGLQIVMCLLERLNMGDTLLKYERTVATALLCHTAWHTAMPGQALARRHILSPVKTVASNLHCKTTLQQKPVGRVTRWMPLTPLGQCKFGCSAPQDPVGRPPAQ